MKYQKIINLLDNTPNQPAKFRTENMTHVEHMTKIKHMSS